jgi:protoheme IX farnesyltransferase
VSSEPIAAAFDISRLPSGRIGSVSLLSDYWELTKPEINTLIVITTAVAFRMGTTAPLSQFPWMQFVQSTLGTTLVASGAAALNQMIELRYDARMHRTTRRPIASGRVAASHALWFGVGLSILGIVYLAASTNVLTSLLATLTLISYLFVYTPLKRITPLCLLVGAIPGAAPPLIGWAAARGRLDAGAWGLFAIVLLWQFPHFMSIAWMYREDYARAGFRVLPSGVNDRNRFVVWQTLAPAAMLVGVTLSLAITGLSGMAYLGGALALGLVFLLYSARFAIRRTNVAARQLLLVSVLYLPAIFALLALDKK